MVLYHLRMFFWRKFWVILGWRISSAIWGTPDAWTHALPSSSILLGIVSMTWDLRLDTSVSDHHIASQCMVDSSDFWLSWCGGGATLLCDATAPGTAIHWPSPMTATAWNLWLLCTIIPSYLFCHCSNIFLHIMIFKLEPIFFSCTYVPQKVFCKYCSK